MNESKEIHENQKPEINSPGWRINMFLESLEHQSLRGGRIAPEIKSAGPYWPEDLWTSFCQRTREALITNGYPEDKADEAIKKATRNVKFIPDKND